MQTADGREAWVAMLERIARPVLGALAQGRLKQSMPIEAPRPDERRPFTHLEALARLLAGMAPWLESGPEHGVEGERCNAFRTLAVAAIEAATDPRSPDCMDFTVHRQTMVEAAFLSHAFLRSPRLWGMLTEPTRRRMIDALASTRRYCPPFNNWLLFAATTEALLARVGESWDRMRVEFALRQHEQWYVGDGHYQDGAHFHNDYYNSFVIQPMLLEVLRTVGDEVEDWKRMRDRALRRARRYGEVQERLIAPDGTFAPFGRSLTYRCGAFQLLAQLALWRELPETLAPGGVRAALSSVIHRTLAAPATFDDAGWLRIGLCGHQPQLAEKYISTGSLYLCSTAFLPLGLPEDDPFWRDGGRWTSQRLWAGEDLPADHASD